MSALDIDISEENQSRISIKEGVFYDISITDYHKIDGLSSTQFQDLDLSVAIYENRHLFKFESEAFNVGNLNHTALLEPHLLHEYIETSTKTFDSKETKKIMELNKDKIVVPYGSIEIAKERAYKTNLIYGKYITPSLKEVSFIVYDEDLRLFRKCRADMWLPNHGIVLDYKTSKEYRPEGFELNSVDAYNYDLSSAWYMDTINMCIDKFKLPYPKVDQFGWIISPNYIPYKPFGGMAEDDIIEKGRVKYAKLVEKYISVTYEGGQDDLFKAMHTKEYYQELKNNK